jgi:hypothetical protein
MTKRITRISPWQAGKLFALVYFATSLLLVIPMALMTAYAPMPAGGTHRLGLGVILCMPFLYALVALIFVPFGCWIYNISANLVGGLEVSVTDANV